MRFDFVLCSFFFAVLLFIYFLQQSVGLKKTATKSSAQFWSFEKKVRRNSCRRYIISMANIKRDARSTVAQKSLSKIEIGALLLLLLAGSFGNRAEEKSQTAQTGSWFVY